MKYIFIFILLIPHTLFADLFSWTNPETGTLMMFDSYEKLTEAKRKYYQKINNSDTQKNKNNPKEFNIELEFNELEQIFSYTWINEIEKIYSEVENINKKFYTKEFSLDECIKSLNKSKEKCANIENIANTIVNEYKNALFKFILLKIRFFETAKQGGYVEELYTIIENSERSLNSSKKAAHSKLNMLLEKQ